MSERPRDLQAAERALDALRSIRQVVQAVWTLARAQQPRVEAVLGDAAAYQQWVDALVARFAQAGRAEAPGEVLWVLAGPERPFCGGLARRLIEQAPAEGRVVLVGRRLAEAVPAGSDLARRVVTTLPAAAGPEEIASRARRVAATLLELDHPGPVRMLHPVEGGITLQPATLLMAAAGSVQRGPETYSDPVEVLAAALHEAVSGRLVVGIAEALRTEVRARLLAAEAARQSCDHRLEALAGQWRVLRQEAITGELLELFSGRLADLGP